MASIHVPTPNPSAPLAILGQSSQGLPTEAIMMRTAKQDYAADAYLQFSPLIRAAATALCADMRLEKIDEANITRRHGQLAGFKVKLDITLATPSQPNRITIGRLQVRGSHFMEHIVSLKEPEATRSGNIYRLGANEVSLKANTEAFRSELLTFLTGKIAQHAAG